MCVNKLMLVVGMLVMPSLVLNAIRYSRPVSRVSSSVVAEIITAMNSNKPKLVLKHLRDNGLSINSQLTDQHETALHLVAQLGKLQAAEMFLAQQGGGVTRVNVRDNEGKTPLAYAQDKGHTQLAELLQTYTQAELAALQNTPKPQDLFAAAADNDRAGVERLLAEGADVRERKKHGHTTYNQLGFKTPFHIAFEAKHYSLAAFLLREAQGINGLDEQGWTPLMLAVMADDWDMVRELIKDGADVFAGYHRRSPMQHALAVAQMMKSEAQLVDIFVEEKGANGVVHTYSKTWPFIILASDRGHTEVVKLLLEQGAELDSEEIMRLAMLRNDWKRILTLIEDEAKLIDVFIAAKGVDGTIGTSGDTLLTLAVEGRHTEIAKRLIDHGADFDITNNYGWTAWTLAAKGGHTEIAKLLIDHGADIHIRGYSGTALTIAAKGGYTETVKLLIDQGADLDVQISDGSTALILAAWQGHIETVKLLIDRGADFDITDNYGMTALRRAVQGGHIETVKFLIDRCANLDIQNSDLALSAANGGHAEIVKLLIDRGADINIQNSDGKTALMLATWQGHAEIVKLLIDRGADLDIADKYGTTVLDIVFRYNHIKPKIRDMLRCAQEQRYKYGIPCK